MITWGSLSFFICLQVCVSYLKQDQQNDARNTIMEYSKMPKYQVKFLQYMWESESQLKMYMYLQMEEVGVSLVDF